MTGVTTTPVLHSIQVHPVSIRYFAVALLLSTLAAHGEQVPEYELKAEFLARFATFIEWPPNDAHAFTIGVIGHNPFNGYLEKIATRKIKNRPVSIRTITEMSQLEGCDIVFICASEKSHLPAILARTESRPILTVADSHGFADAGVLINF